MKLVGPPQAIVLPVTAGCGPEEVVKGAQRTLDGFAAFESTKTPITARLIVGRVRDRAGQGELLPVWRHHPFFTNKTEQVAQADITHRRHTIIKMCSPTSSTGRSRTCPRPVRREQTAPGPSARP